MGSSVAAEVESDERSSRGGSRTGSRKAHETSGKDFKQVSNTIRTADCKAHSGGGIERSKSGSRRVRREARKERWISQNLGCDGNDERRQNRGVSDAQ